MFIKVLTSIDPDIDSLLSQNKRFQISHQPNVILKLFSFGYEKKTNFSLVVINKM